MTEFSIYQINVDRDTANVCFIGMESLEKIKGTKEVNAAAYDRVYDGKMDCISLENIYQKFNVDHPADYKGRSLSVSDVVEIRESDTLNPGFYFVDSIGFKSISFDKSLCKEPVEAGSGKISILLVEPNKYPKMIEIDDTLEAMQAIVGGDIEEYMPFEDEVAIVCHEEGKLIGLPPNRAIYAEPETVELTYSELADRFRNAESVPFPVSWTVKMKKKQKETQDILSYHTQAAGCSDKARAKASGGRQPIEECGRTGL